MQVWNLTNCKLRHNLAGHTGYINTVTVSPDGSLCASGGKVRSSLVTGHVTTVTQAQVIATLDNTGKQCAKKAVMCPSIRFENICPSTGIQCVEPCM